MGKTIFHKPLTWAGRKAGLDVCFTAKMQLQLADGSWCSMSNVRPGTLVASRDECNENGEIVGKVVEEVFERWGLVWIVNVDGKEIETTAEHPFWVDGQKWTPANELQVGDVVRLRDGWGTVEGVRDTGRWETVYNCRVDEWHTYFVGMNEWGWAVWVHNASCELEQVLGVAGDADAALRWRLNQAVGTARNGTIDQFVEVLGDLAPSGAHQQRVAYMAAMLRDGMGTGRAEIRAAAQRLGLTDTLRRPIQQELAQRGFIQPGLRGRGGSTSTRTQLETLADTFDEAGFPPSHGVRGLPEEPIQRIPGVNLGSAPADMTLRSHIGQGIRVNTTTMSGGAGARVPHVDEIAKARRAVTNLGRAGDPHDFMVLIPKESNGSMYIMKNGQGLFRIPEMDPERLIQLLHAVRLI
ncbi:MAG: polymorphic toxin-type HINT domain-containing protein [Fimbriiglobus sp.]